jgi:hypothetical protein
MSRSFVFTCSGQHAMDTLVLQTPVLPLHCVRHFLWKRARTCATFRVLPPLGVFLMTYSTASHVHVLLSSVCHAHHSTLKCLNALDVQFRVHFSVLYLCYILSHSEVLKTAFHVVRTPDDAPPFWLTREFHVFGSEVKITPVWWPGVKNSPNVAHACRKRRLKWAHSA